MHTRQEDPWSRSEAEYPWSAPLRERMRFLLGYAILAPSGHNTQPWLFRVSGSGVDVRADQRRELPVVDPHDRELAISCGAAVGTFEVAARRFGRDVTVNTPAGGRDPDLLARVEVAKGEPASEPEIALFDAILQRRTTRMGPALARWHPRLVGLTGSKAALAEARAAFGVETEVVFNGPEGPVYAHGSFIYLVGPDGRALTLLPPILGPERMAEIIAGYL